MVLNHLFMSFSKPNILRNAQHRQKQRGGKNLRQASCQRISCLGLEMKPELVWEDWDLQKEFTKTLVLKNINNKLQKLYVRS